MPTAVAIAPIDAQTAYDLLAAAVELAGPDHLYQPDGDGDGCFYVHDDGNQPGCIVGVALSIHGVPLEVMDEWWAGIANVIANHDAPYLTPDAVDVFQAAQSVQDRSVMAGDTSATWGKALEAAAAELARLNA